MQDRCHQHDRAVPRKLIDVTVLKGNEPLASGSLLDVNSRGAGIAFGTNGAMPSIGEEVRLHFPSRLFKKPLVLSALGQGLYPLHPPTPTHQSAG